MARVSTPRLPKGPPVVSVARLPVPRDNPRHLVYVDDEQGLRTVTPSEPGRETFTLDGQPYTHTRNMPTGQWIYTRNL
jgi:hypothetical protein